IHLLFSANRWELAASIERDLQEGITIVCDRYAFSGAVFSAAKGLPLEWCKAPDAGLPAPDAVLFLDISPEKAAERGGYGEERYEKREMQEQVRAQFAVLGKQVKGWTRVDAGRSVEEVQQDISAVVKPLIELVQGQTERLWVDDLPGR
ncbi:P-loop containing nucleoside triphosphate hydrolase protein, partial [Dacryopinax primogenitus]